ncbi:MAG TPA: ATP-binding protein, partial [Flavobacteriales bacterium]|nr:ATP-binding protein [Flavobacteriales bacterium]
MRYHNALDSMMEGVQIIGFDWRYLYVNDAVVAQSRYTREELLGRTMMEMYPGIENTEMFKALEQCMKDRTTHVMQNEFTFPDGSVGYFELSVQPMTDGVFILSTDITGRWKAEMAIAHQRERLELQNKELEQFAYVASHDLQEPLRMVTSFLQLLQRRYKADLAPEAQEFISFATDGAVRMKQLIADLLSYSQLGRAVDTVEVDMDAVFDQVTVDLSVAIKESGAVVERTGLPHVRASRTEMGQLLQNLIANAIKFRRKDTAPRVNVRGRREKDVLHFELSDNGIGIPEQYKDKVFLPFKRLHDRSLYSGSGIGLAIAHKIVVRYGGR